MLAQPAGEGVGDLSGESWKRAALCQEMERGVGAVAGVMELGGAAREEAGDDEPGGRGEVAGGAEGEGTEGRRDGGMGLQQGAVVFAFEAADFFLHDFQFHGELVEGLEDIGLGFGMIEVREGRVDLHRLPGDLPAGIADLLNGGSFFHKAAMLAATRGM